MSSKSVGWASSKKKKGNVRLFGELSSQNRIYQEHQARDWLVQRNYEDFAVSKRIESDTWALMQLLCRRKRIPPPWISLWPTFRNYRTRRIPWLKKKNSIILRQPAALGCPTFPPNPREFSVTEERLSSILVCRKIHGTWWWKVFWKICWLQKGIPIGLQDPNEFGIISLRIEMR